MFFSKAYILIFVVVLAAACSKHTDTETGSGNNQGGDTKLVGTWRWVRTDGGIGDNIHETPLSTGNQMALTFTAGGTYLIYTNGVKTSEGTYTLQAKTCIHDLTDKMYINFSADQDLMVEKIDNKNLWLSDEFYDGLGSLYKKSEASSY